MERHRFMERHRPAALRRMGLLHWSGIGLHWSGIDLLQWRSKGLLHWRSIGRLHWSGIGLLRRAA